MTDEELTAFLRDLPFLRAAEAADRIEALTEQLNTCRMAQAVMDNTVAEAVKMLDEQDRKYNRMTNDMIERHSAKLAKVVNCLWMAKEYIRDLESHEGAEGFSVSTGILGKAYYATLAEIEGSTSEGEKG